MVSEYNEINWEIIKKPNIIHSPFISEQDICYYIYQLKTMDILTPTKSKDEKSTIPNLTITST